MRYYACGNCRMGTAAYDAELEELKAKLANVLAQAEHLALDNPKDRAQLQAMLLKELAP